MMRHILIATIAALLITACGGSSDGSSGVIGGCVQTDQCTLYEGPSSSAPSFQKWCTDTQGTWSAAGCTATGRLGCCRDDKVPAQFTVSECYYGATYTADLPSLRSQCLADGNHWQ